jgi:hypothetical protein
MALPWQSKSRRGAGSIAGVGLLIAIILLLAASGSSLALHKKICPDAGTPNDHCAVVDFVSGVLAAGPLLAALIFIALVFVPVRFCLREEIFQAAPLFRLSSARPPPHR